MVSVKLFYAASLLSLAFAAAQNDNAGGKNVANAGGKQGQNAGANAGKGQGQNAGAAAASADAAKGTAAAAANNGAKAAANNNNNNAGAAAKSSSTAAAAASSSAAAATNNKGGNNNANNANNGNNAAASATSGGNADSTTLQANAIQSGSFFDGQSGLGADATEAASTTSQNNFINFCSGQTLTNGLQITDGSCNGIVMGQIPAKAQMVSTVITFPQDGKTIQAGQDFNITVQVANLQAGAFTNADATYYAAPQQLKGGQIVGHTHVTVQDMGKSLNPTTPPDATQFAFFKGINDAGDGKGGLSAIVSGGLPAGNYRLCTLTSAANHQPVIMPVAQRGAQDDCTRFTVTGNGGATNVAANDGSKGEAAAAAAQSAVDIGPGALTASAAAAAATTAAANNNNNNNNNGGKANANANAGAKAAKGGKAQRLARFKRRTFVA
ncbi:ribosomal protein s17 [Ophiostoma piceae UAMH 11346]|uniref:Ribosomal protein s17 n=1 Tax=Ophiostoma piceae (strain UAMH 11346) TaxID=1262450 RepID=S3CSM3_OPHP1|nr:ribosomal protein s17 [Ophiostoma piceae UAMH 11346]